MSQKQMQNHKFFEGQKHALSSWASCSTNEVSSISDGAMLDIGNMTWLFANAAVWAWWLQRILTSNSLPAWVEASEIKLKCIAPVMDNAARESYISWVLRCHESTAVWEQPALCDRRVEWRSPRACRIVTLVSRSWLRSSKMASGFMQTFLFRLCTTCPGAAPRSSAVWLLSLRLEGGILEVSCWAIYTWVTYASKPWARKSTRAFCVRRKQVPIALSARHGWAPAVLLLFSTENVNFTSSCNVTATFSSLVKGSHRSPLSNMFCHCFCHTTKHVRCLVDSISSNPVTSPAGEIVKGSKFSSGMFLATFSVRPALLQIPESKPCTSFMVVDVLDSFEM